MVLNLGMVKSADLKLYCELWRLKSLLLPWGQSLCLTLYIRIAMSWRRLLSSVGKLALRSKSLQVDCLSLKTALSPLSWIRSSFLVSLALQKCQVRWQYMRYGKIAALYNCDLAFVGIKFLSLIRTAILWLAFLHTLLCSLKFIP
jgi:hypothetical protein